MYKPSYLIQMFNISQMILLSHILYIVFIRKRNIFYGAREITIT